MTHVVWLRWSFILITLTCSFISRGALPLQEDKPAEPKDFKTKYSQPLTQPPTRPVALKNPDYVCSFNALMQVLWVLEPLNAALRRGYDVISRTYRASITAKNTLSGPLSLTPFIEKMNNLAKDQLVNPTDILDKFFGAISGKAYALFLVNYSQRTYCDNKKRVFHTPDYLHVPAEPKYITIPVTQNSTNLQKALTSAQKFDYKCQCGENLMFSLTPLDNFSPKILVINTNRQEGMEKIAVPYTFPLFNLKFGKKIYDLVGVIFHTGEGAGAGRYYAWVEYYGTWYKCNDEEIKSFAKMKEEKQFKIVPLTETDLLVYVEKSIIKQIRIAHSKTFHKEVQKSQYNVAHSIWKQKKTDIKQFTGNINSAIKNLPTVIEENFKKQWEPVLEGM